MSVIGQRKALKLIENFRMIFDYIILVQLKRDKNKLVSRIAGCCASSTECPDRNLEKKSFPFSN